MDRQTYFSFKSFVDSKPNSETSRLPLVRCVIQQPQKQTTSPRRILVVRSVLIWFDLVRLPKGFICFSLVLCSIFGFRFRVKLLYVCWYFCFFSIHDPAKLVLSLWRQVIRLRIGFRHLLNLSLLTFAYILLESYTSLVLVAKSLLFSWMQVFSFHFRVKRSCRKVGARLSQVYDLNAMFGEILFYGFRLCLNVLDDGIKYSLRWSGDSNFVNRWSIWNLYNLRYNH